jgi:hypothetical protein
MGSRMEVVLMAELLESQSKTPFPNWMKWAALIVGFLLIVDGIRTFAFYTVLVGVIVLYISGYTKRIYLSEEGIVKETGSWIRKNRSVLGWQDVQYVGLAKRGTRMMAFFEKDITGWKVLFNAEDEFKLREILGKYRPEIEIAVLEDK